MIVRLVAAGLVISLAAPAFAQGGGAQPAPQQPQTNADDQNPDQGVTYEEQVVVTASRTEELLVNAPAAISVVTNETIQNSPATNIGDLLRAIPGVNVTQVSARDVNITSRGATGTLSTSQLALVDGRSIYLDFFGMVMWDLVPANPINADLAAEVGPGWVHTFTGELSHQVLAAGLQALDTTARSPAPDLSGREWADTGERHRAAYAEAIRLQSLRPRWRLSSG